MASPTSLTTVQKLYIAYYGRAADAAGQQYWADQLDLAGGSLTGIVDAFANAPEAQALYGSGTSTADRVTVLYQNVLGRAPDEAGLAYYVARVQGTWVEPDGTTLPPLSLGNLALSILDGVQPGTSDAPLADHRLAVANTFTAQVSPAPLSYAGDAAAAIARTFLKQVTGEPATVAQANDQLPAWLNTIGVASKQGDKFAPLIANGLLTNTAIVSTTLTEDNLDATIAALGNDTTAPMAVQSGKVVLAVGEAGGFERSTQMALQADGKIVVTGTVGSGTNSDFGLVRLNLDGSLDSSFGSNGLARIAVSPFFEGSTSLTLQADGKIVVAGSAEAGHALARLNANGTPDTSFGTTGAVMLSSTGSSALRGVAVQADGKIVAAGDVALGGMDADFSVVRVNANGSPDTGFGTNGQQTVTFGESQYDAANALVVQADGKIIVVGLTSPGSASHFAVARLNADGSLDTSFDGDGKVQIPVGAGGFARSVVLQADGKVLVAGYSSNTANGLDFNLVRLNTDGSLDASFGSGGTATVTAGGEANFGYSVTLQADGKILMAGGSRASLLDPDARTVFSLVRLNADGSLDTGFDGDGRVQVSMSGGSDEGHTVAVQADGKIVVAGNAQRNDDNDWGVVRLNADGSLDSSFGGFGHLLQQDGNATADAGDRLELRFSEAVGNKAALEAQLTGNARFGSTATVQWSANDTLLTLILGEGETYDAGTAIALTGVQDLTGNSADLSYGFGS